MMTLISRTLAATALLLALTYGPDPANAFMPMRRAAPNNVVDRGWVNAFPDRKAPVHETGLGTGRPLTGGRDDGTTTARLPRAPGAREYAEGSRGGVCPLRLRDVFQMTEACDVGGTASAIDRNRDEAAPVEGAGVEVAATTAGMVVDQGIEEEMEREMAVMTVEMTDLKQGEEEGGGEEKGDEGGAVQEWEVQAEEGKEEDISLGPNTRATTSASTAETSSSSAAAVAAALASAHVPPPSAPSVPFPAPAGSLTGSAPENEWWPLPGLVAQKGAIEPRSDTKKTQQVTHAPATGGVWLDGGEEVQLLVLLEAGAVPEAINDPFFRRGASKGLHLASGSVTGRKSSSSSSNGSSSSATTSSISSASGKINGGGKGNMNGSSSGGSGGSSSSSSKSSVQDSVVKKSAAARAKADLKDDPKQDGGPRNARNNTSVGRWWGGVTRHLP